MHCTFCSGYSSEVQRFERYRDWTFLNANDLNLTIDIVSKPVREGKVFALWIHVRCSLLRVGMPFERALAAIMVDLITFDEESCLDKNPV